MSAPAPIEQIDVFVSGTEGYHTFRIPALIVSPKGTLLAFCEGRKGGRSDSGNIDTLLKRSVDGGKTWGALQVVADDGPHTMGNPCPVVDGDTGRIWLPLTRNLGQDTEREIKALTAEGTREAWITYSDDDGATWAKAANITAAVKDPKWTWYATGPGVGIQLKSGRLLIPCDHAVAGSQTQYSHAFFSDDHGKTWQLGATIGSDTDECQAVELEDGSVLMNMRSYHGKNRRAVAVSKDGGATWGEVTFDQALIEPVCQASFLRLTSSKGGGKSRVLFSNPASTQREKMTVRLSYDEAKTWPVARELHAGPAAYSCLTVLPDGMIACLYERGDKSAYERITLARLSLDWLTHGEDK